MTDTERPEGLEKPGCRARATPGRWRPRSPPRSARGAFPTYLELAGSDALLGTRRAVKVAGTLDGHPFEATLMPSGSGPHWLPLRAALCKAIGKADAGEQVEVHLLQRTS